LSYSIYLPFILLQPFSAIVYEQIFNQTLVF
jgi:hypothetical protein